jgi:hypothetical protein
VPGGESALVFWLKTMKDEHQRGFVSNFTRIVEALQELLLKVELLVKKVDDVLDLLNKENGSD